MMNQFRIERNDHGNLRIYCRDMWNCGMYLERCVCLRQFNQSTGRYE